jgi:molybdenum cofactor cytidylyltransferase
MAYANIAVALLAAGQGKRFGGDKLSAELDGVPLGLRTAGILADIGFGYMFAVCKDASLTSDLTGLGFHILHNDMPDMGQSHSLHIAVRAAQQTSVQALLVCLADMPFVTAAHIANIIAKANKHDGIIASHNGTRAMPPALFPRSRWPQLLNTKGDAGARSLLVDALHIKAPPQTLIDIDTAPDLAAARDRR